MWSLFAVLVIGVFLIFSTWSSSAQRSQVKREMHEKGTDVPYAPKEIFQELKKKAYERNFRFSDPKFLDVPLKYQRYHSASPNALEYLKYENVQPVHIDNFWSKQEGYRTALLRCVLAQMEYDAGYQPTYKSKTYHKDRFNCWDYVEENYAWYMEECEKNEERWLKKLDEDRKKKEAAENENKN